MKGTTIAPKIEVRELPDMPIAYLRHVGSYKGNEQLFEKLFGELMAWAGPKGLLQFPKTKMLAVYYDDSDMTTEENMQVDVALTVPADTKVDGKIKKTTLPGGKYAVAQFELAPDEYEQAWNTVFNDWIPENDYRPSGGPCFENYLNDPKEHPEGKHVVEICVPVKPL
jgi:AraC family transcriptional regulator